MHDVPTKPLATIGNDFNMTRVLIVLAFCLSAVAHPAIAQTPEVLAAADRLIAVQNIDATMDDMARAVADTLPGATDPQKRAFITEMTAPAFLDRYKAAMRLSLTKHLTVEELNALAEFYSKPIASAAMKKMAATTAELMPFIQAEVPSIIARVMKASQK
jgi:uncharacterized protein